MVQILRCSPGKKVWIKKNHDTKSVQFLKKFMIFKNIRF
jgi:hypothetical protein